MPRYSLTLLAATIFVATSHVLAVSLRGSLVSLNPLLLGANCTADADCLSEKCFPEHKTYGPNVCSPSAAGVHCSDGSTCISGTCLDGFCDRTVYGSTNGTCYKSSDCYSDYCSSPYIAGAIDIQCRAADVGHACNDKTGCISNNCTAGICSGGTSQCYFYASQKCAAGYCCTKISTSSIIGICIPGSSGF